MIIDANVLIDYLRAEEQVLALAGRHLGVVHVVRDVVEEVDDLDDDRCAKLGLKIIEPTTEHLLAAGSHPRTALSFEDRLCLLLAKESGFVCVSNDRALRSACVAETVGVMWGLQLMLRLVDAAAMTEAEAVLAAEAIHAANPAHITSRLVADFRLKAHRRRAED